MKTHESNGSTDYIYYPIEYTTKALGVVVSWNEVPPHNDYPVWVLLVDKSKFLDGAGAEQYGSNLIVMNMISVGF